MSLNGLDEAKVAEAHQAALAEAGGWFLLHYTTRDTVELLSRGSGGVAEVRSAITKYEEKSPLFGLVQFRRKKIILKYVPEGTSRLLQVRLTVQFQSVLETFVPHDTVLSFATPTELTESALTSACMLHPSPMSLTSSASSLRRQRLGEISEDAEESPHIRGQSKSKVVATPAPPSTKLTDHDRKEPSPVVAVEPLVEKAHPVLLREQPEVAPPAANKEAAAAQDSSISTPRGSSATPTPRAAPAAEKALPSTPQPTPPSTSGGQTSTPPVPDDAPELPPIQHLSNSYRVEESESRVSLQSARPSVHEGRPSFPTLYDSYDPNKPKVKRGPRPHVASESRPQTAGSKGGQSQRLVANLPTSVRAQPRLTANTDRPGSQQSSRSVPSKFVHYSQPPPLPLLPSPHHISSLFLPESQPERAYSRAGSITSTATAAATPEKLRLMKALQMRKRNQQMAKHESETSEQPETSKTSVQSQVAADLEPVRSHPATRSSGAESTSASRIAEATKATEAARMTSPTSMTTVSEVPSTQSSSFVEDNDTTSHASISSDTSSSVTPKADIREAQQRKQAESPMPVPAKELDEQEAPALLASRSLHDAPLTREIENTARPSTAESIISSDLDEDVPQYHESAPEHEQSILAAPADPPQVGGNITDAVPLNHESSEAEQEARPPVPSKSDDDDDDQARRRKRADLEPIKLLSSPELSDASDDDSFMEELHNAKVQHAKPIAVGRSPATPIYRTLSGSVDRLKDVSRTVSGPLHNSANSASTSPEHSRPRSVRSISTALPSWPPSNENIPPVPLAKKGPLSSGISKRIKALEVFTSGREPSASPPPVTQLNTLAQKSKAALSSSRKRLSFIQGGNASNTSIATPAPALFSSLTQTPEMESTEYDRSTALFQNHSTITETYKPQQKGETISVTARIVRHPDTINEDSTSATNDSQSIPLQRSKLTFDHEQPAPSDRPALAREPSTFSNDTPGKFSQNERARPSFSSYRSESQTRLPTSESMASRLSVVSGKRRDRSNLPRSSSDNSSVTTEKSRQSRTRRLMMRVSNLSTNSRRNIVGVFSPNPKDQTAAQSITERAESDHDLASIAESVSHVVDIGDVNVQFSDTLLWKRRFLRIDDQGYLIFTPPTMERNVRNISRKFHLTEFKKPTLPDVEREEMAWSILLDSEDGSCIQCACESKYSQTQVLRMLVDAHNAYHQLYSA